MLYDEKQCRRVALPGAMAQKAVDAMLQVPLLEAGL
jgi:hypothetical protein